MYMKGQFIDTGLFKFYIFIARTLMYERNEKNILKQR